MAVEKDFELLDNYLAGRLSDSERLAFEEKLGSDPELKNEYELQQQLVNSLKKARIAELKAMMNTVSVPSVHGTETTLATKIALWTVVVGLVATGVYFYLNTEKEVKETPETEIQQHNEIPPVPQPEAVQPTEELKSHENPPVVSGQQSASEQKPSQSPKPTNKKKEDKVSNERSIDVFDPTEEKQEELATQLEKDGRVQKLNSSPSIAVEIDSKNKKYDFHYQFKEEKLFLYGPFEENLYEIMEFIGEDKRTMFLFYQDNYYLLKDDNEKLKPLGLIHDTTLIKKLKEYRRK